MVKAVFLALCFGEEAPGRRAAGRFVNCFYTETEHIRLVKQEDEDGNPITLEERTTVISPLPLSAACGNLYWAGKLRRATGRTSYTSTPWWQAVWGM